MPKPCKIDHVVSQPYTPDQCRVCWLYTFDPVHKAIWDKGHSGVDPTWPCVHRGEAIGSVDCPTCKGSVRVKLYECSQPDVWQRQATIGKQVDKVTAVCAACSFRVAPTPAQG